MTPLTGVKWRFTMARRPGVGGGPMRPRRLRPVVSLALLSIIALAFLVVTPAPTATASDFHMYSFGYIAPSIGKVFTGLDQERYDHTMSISGSTNCTVYFNTKPAYQSEWVSITGLATTWMELGTGHQCDGFEYWYGGYGYEGAFHWLWHEEITGGSEHSFYLKAYKTGSSQSWNWTIDSTSFYTLANGWKGDIDEAGLESYDSSLSVVYHTYSLKYAVTDQTSWSSWFGTTEAAGSGTSPMCYHQTSTTVIYVGENTAC